MDIQITPAKLSGAVTPPPSKSMAHRLIIAAALADGVSTLENIVPSQDIEATLRCMTVLGARWEAPKPGTICVHTFLFFMFYFFWSLKKTIIIFILFWFKSCRCSSTIS